MIENPFKDAMIQFLTAEGCQPIEIYPRMKFAYDDYSYSHTGMAE